MRYSKLIAIATMVTLLSACQTAMDRRISAHEATWRGLSPQDQQRLRRGNVHSGDTEEMVRIALGAPDRTLATTGWAGQKQTIWEYHLPYLGNDNFNPDSFRQATGRELSVILQNGKVMNGAGAPATSLAEHRDNLGAEDMTARLDALVALTREQKAKAAAIFQKANVELLAYGPGERSTKGNSIRVQARADIRALLTPEQQAKYDVAPGYWHFTSHWFAARP